MNGLAKYGLMGIILIAVLSACGGAGAPAEPAVRAGDPDAAVSADGVPIHYRMEGEGDYSLVFVHGWCADMTYWVRQVPSFRVYYRVVTMDLAGHGRSGMERTSWTMDSFARDVEAVVKKLELDNVILVGHAMGGNVILEAARLMPRRVIGLIGIDTFSDIYLRPQSPERISVMLEVFRPDFSEGIRKYALENYFRSNSTEPYRKRIVLDLAESKAEIALPVLEDQLRFDGAAALDSLSVPIRAINTDRPVLPFGIIRERAKDFKLKFMKNVGHFLMQEDPSAFNRLMAEWLGEIIQASYQRRAGGFNPAGTSARSLGGV